MGCTFCASATSGFVRNLTGEEIMAQVSAAEIYGGEPPARVVLMGVGEPLDNMGEVSRQAGIEYLIVHKSHGSVRFPWIYRVPHQRV
ncbi:hypothetical protein FACS1894120_6670 [Clostridia bacterium]|nr:hypothetical protein FACS1894120_6670 [Clostridia bacterium]